MIMEYIPYLRKSMAEEHEPARLYLDHEIFIFFTSKATYFSAVEEKGIALVNMVKGASSRTSAIKGREFPMANLI